MGGPITVVNNLGELDAFLERADRRELREIMLSALCAALGILLFVTHGNPVLLVPTVAILTRDVVRMSRRVQAQGRASVRLLAAIRKAVETEIEPEVHP